MVEYRRGVWRTELRVRFDLEVHAWEQDGEIGVYWMYNRDLFDRWRMEQMARHYVRVLEAMAANPETLLDIDVWDAGEITAIIEEFNASI
jgi:non-ribosomal peptide synthetase component F